jgi:hypothetical protein
MIGKCLKLEMLYIDGSLFLLFVVFLFPAAGGEPAKEENGCAQMFTRRAIR